MDHIMGKAGSYLVNRKAGKEISSVKEEIHSISNSIGEGAKWLANKIKGKMQRPLQELLKEYDLPIGIFPGNATDYEFNEEEKRLTVNLPSVCEVVYDDSSVLRFNTTVTGRLERGKLTDIEGLKTRVVIWIKVSEITSEGSNLYFTAGLRKTRTRETYEMVKDGDSIKKF